jgi:hypothetical protein
VRCGAAASATRISPLMSHGWRPISVTYQPLSVATQPENVIIDNAFNAAL